MNLVDFFSFDKPLKMISKELTPDPSPFTTLRFHKYKKKTLIIYEDCVVNYINYVPVNPNILYNKGQEKYIVTYEPDSKIVIRQTVIKAIKGFDFSQNYMLFLKILKYFSQFNEILLSMD